MTRKSAKADLNPVPGVYRVWCSDKHYYIGRSSDIDGRCKGHERGLRNGNHPNPHMQAVFNKHGSFRYEVLETAGEAEAINIEQGLIDKHLSDPLCMNICDSAEIPTRKGLRNTPEHNAKISAAHKGRTYSEETLANMSEGQKRRFAGGWSPELRESMMASRDTPEYRAKISAALTGRTLSEDHKAKIGDAVRGHVKSEETRARLSESLKGRVFSDEHRAKLSAAQRKRKPISEETREKMRAAQKRRQAREREARRG
jgi:group I intron endonuclease